MFVNFTVGIRLLRLFAKAGALCRFKSGKNESENPVLNILVRASTDYKNHNLSQAIDFFNAVRMACIVVVAHTLKAIKGMPSCHMVMPRCYIPIKMSYAIAASKPQKSIKYVLSCFVDPSPLR